MTAVARADCDCAAPEFHSDVNTASGERCANCGRPRPYVSIGLRADRFVLDDPRAAGEVAPEEVEAARSRFRASLPAPSWPASVKVDTPRKLPRRS